jgi:hypothetical protein
MNATNGLDISNPQGALVAASASPALQLVTPGVPANKDHIVYAGPIVAAAVAAKGDDLMGQKHS